MLQSSDWAPWWGVRREAEKGRGWQEQVGVPCPASVFTEAPWAQLHEANQKPREEVERQLCAVRFCSGRAWGRLKAPGIRDL